MRESIGIDSVLGGWAMPKAYSEDMRERLAVGEACRFSVGSDCATARPDPGGGGSGDAQAQDSWQPQRDVALLQASQRHFQKKACTRRSRSARTWRERASAGCENRACLILPTWSSSTRLPPIPRWCG